MINRLRNSHRPDAPPLPDRSSADPSVFSTIEERKQVEAEKIEIDFKVD